MVGVHLHTQMFSDFLLGLSDTYMYVHIYAYIYMCIYRYMHTDRKIH